MDLFFVLMFLLAQACIYIWIDIVKTLGKNQSRLSAIECNNQVFNQSMAPEDLFYWKNVLIAGMRSESPRL